MSLNFENDFYKLIFNTFLLSWIFSATVQEFVPCFIGRGGTILGNNLLSLLLSSYDEDSS